MQKGKFQVISLFDIQKMIYGDTAQHWGKPVPKPSAQCNKLLPAPKHQALQSELLQSIIAGDRHTPRIISAVVELLVVNGLRISEVLRIKGPDISEKGYIKIEGSKGSYDRIVLSPVHKDFWLSMRNTTDSIGSVFSRFYFYRELKKRGISLDLGPGKNKAVTHAARHLLITELSSIDKELLTVQRNMGHKSLKSTQHYAENKNKKPT